VFFNLHSQFAFMNFIITHTTSYRYSSPVNVCHNVMMLEPRESPTLRCNEYTLDIQPPPRFRGRREDMFGNFVHRFSLEENHSVLKVTATSRVTVEAKTLPPADSTPTCSEVSTASRDHSDPNWLQVSPFFFDSPRIKRSAEFASFAAASIQPKKSIITAATDLTRQIYTDFKYDKDATKVDTPTETAFAGRHGVCQDFAHIAVACLRSCNLPARYVSGYLRTIPAPGTKRLIGNDESHAWFSVYCGSELGWLDFDPTNNCACGADHVPIAFGRDYSDVVPVKGIFLGGGNTTLSVSVDVAVA
jgi:transglutaminase-like putative cysteine protease